MADHEPPKPLAPAGEEFDRHESRDDGIHVARRLWEAMNILSRSFYERVHRDVEQKIGADSLFVPLSEAKSWQRTSQEIEAFQIAESALAAGHYNYVSGADSWYLEWLAGLRLTPEHLTPAVRERCAGYLAKGADARRLHFSDLLGRVLPESRRAPLVLFRLMPPAVRVATALAFSDRTAAKGLRRQQIDVLPAISDCRSCHGEVLPSGEQCATCGNPLWTYDWLTVVD